MDPEEEETEHEDEEPLSRLIQRLICQDVLNAKWHFFLRTVRGHPLMYNVISFVCLEVIIYLFSVDLPTLGRASGV